MNIKYSLRFALYCKERFEYSFVLLLLFFFAYLFLFTHLFSFCLFKLSKKKKLPIIFGKLKTRENNPNYWLVRYLLSFFFFYLFLFPGQQTMESSASSNSDRFIHSVVELWLFTSPCFQISLYCSRSINLFFFFFNISNWMRNLFCLFELVSENYTFFSEIII